MRRIERLVGLVSAGMLAWGAAAALAQEGMPKLTPEQQKACELASTVGDEHKLLDAMVGDWTTTCKFQMTPDSPWMESAGTCSNKWILDGRFVQCEMRGEMMGQPHVGISTVGYDGLKGKYVNTWMDNHCTSITMGEGTYDPSTKTFTFHTEFVDPMNPKAPTKVRYTITVKDKDTHVFEWYQTTDGKEAKSMEITYKRKGAA
jgi:hypothetical protein